MMMLLLWHANPDVVRAVWMRHLDRCNVCNYNRECMVCELGGDVENRPEYHACWCAHSNKVGWILSDCYQAVQPLLRAAYKAAQKGNG